MMKFDADSKMTWFRAEPARGAQSVDREQHVIHGAAIVTEGEAKGHGVNLDSEFVERVAELGAAFPNGLKARFGHPTASGSDPLGTYLGRWKNFRVEQGADGRALARADLHFSETAAATPNGDLRSYVEGLAANDPDMFGTSIVFMRGQTYRRDASGSKVYPYTAKGERNESYDEASGPTFVEIDSLHAADAVDEPAANDGLFSSWTRELTAARVTEFLDENPQVWELLENPEIAAGFAARYEAHRERHAAQTQTKKATTMSTFSRILAALGVKPKDGEDDKQLQARFDALNEAFDDADFVREQFEAGHDVDEAQAAWTAREQQAQQDSQLAELQARIETLTAANAEQAEEIAALQKANADQAKLLASAKERPPVEPPKKKTAGAEDYKAQWEADEQLQAEFRTAASYEAYMKAHAEGRVKIHGENG